MNTNGSVEREITDLSMIGKVISSLFPRIPISMYYENEQTPIQIISANQEGIVIKGTDRLDYGIRILTFTNNFSLYHFWFELMPGSNADIEFLKPIKMVIREDAKRIESRVVVTKKSEEKIYVQSIVSQEIIFENLEQILSDLQPIWKSRSAALMGKFKSMELKLDAKDNLRMTIFRGSTRPIFIPMPGNKDPYSTAFFNPIQYKEILNQSTDLQPIEGAEITIPLLFRDKILLGYIRVTHDNMLRMDDFHAISSVASILMAEINSHEELIHVKEKCEVIDISSGGLGFLASISENHQKILIPGNILFFTLILLEEKIPMKAVIRYVAKETGNLFRIGSEFYDLTLDEKARLREISKTLSTADITKEK